MKKLIIVILVLFCFVSLIQACDLTISFVLDETGSMEDIRDQTIDSFNEYLSTLQGRNEKLRMTLTKFNSSNVEIAYENADIEHIKKLNRNNYIPQHGTPLYDAIGNTIESLKGVNNVLFIILTDGLENSSRKYTQKDIFKMIGNKQDIGWTFVFLGADQDKYVAENIGIQSGNIFNWDGSNVGIGTSSPMQQLISNTCSFLDSGTVKTSDFFKNDSLKSEK